MCIKGIERDPCLDQWVGLGRGERVVLLYVCVKERERERVLGRGEAASHIWLALSELQPHMQKLCWNISPHSPDKRDESDRGSMRNAASVKSVVGPNHPPPLVQEGDAA